MLLKPTGLVKENLTGLLCKGLGAVIHYQRQSKFGHSVTSA